MKNFTNNQKKEMKYYFFKIYYLFKYICHRIFTPFYKIGWPVVFCRGAEINNARYIQLGGGVYLGKNSLIEIDYFHHLEYGSHKPKIKIGNNVSIGAGTLINAVSDIQLEDDVIIASNCHIADNSHRFDKVDTSIRYQGLNKVNPIKIKKGTWLGWNVVVCPGVTIGKNSVIGANSVVTKDIPDYCVAVGAPAKVIKKYDFESGKWLKV